MSNMIVSILTPVWSLKNINASEVILPTTTGKIGILKDHASIISTLEVGVVSIKTDSEWQYLVIFGGTVIVNNNQMTLAVIGVEKAQDIPDTIESEFLQAKQNAENVKNQSDKVEAILSFKRSKARLEAFKMIKK